MTSISSSSRRPWLQSYPEPGQSTSRSHSFDARLTAGKKYNADDTSMSFTREQLKCAQVIGQVDTKFVACMVDDRTSKGSRTLILVDQHAADERIRVEQFLSEVCQGFLYHGLYSGVETWELKPAIPILLTRLEARNLARSKVYQHAFERWGFRFASMSHADAAEGDEDEYFQVLVETVPELVGEKVMEPLTLFNQISDA